MLVYFNFLSIYNYVKYFTNYQRMVIDERRENILTKLVSSKGVRIKSESDHNPLYAEFNLTFSKARAAERREIFDFKNAASQKRFSEITADCQQLKSCFKQNQSPKVATDNFLKSLNSIFH